MVVVGGESLVVAVVGAEPSVLVVIKRGTWPRVGTEALVVRVWNMP